MLSHIVFEPTKPGENPILVEYYPYTDPTSILGKVDETKAISVVSEIIPRGDGFGQRKVLSTSVVSLVAN